MSFALFCPRLSELVQLKADAGKHGQGCMENIVRLKLSIAHTNTTGSATEKELAARLTHWQEPMMRRCC
jgi:hypothetical protein